MTTPNPAWEYFDKVTKNVYYQLGSGNLTEIKKIKSKDLHFAKRESLLFGYDDNGAYKLLENEIERRDSQNKLALTILGVTIGLAGLFYKLLS